jgi:hypothetical protein
MNRLQKQQGMLLVLKYNKLLYQLEINVIHDEVNSRLNLGILATIHLRIFFHPMSYLTYRSYMSMGLWLSWLLTSKF